MILNDGLTACVRCGQRFCAVGALKEATCGDCIEYRTPLKREIAKLRAENERLRAAFSRLEVATLGCVDCVCCSHIGKFAAETLRATESGSDEKETR